MKSIIGLVFFFILSLLGINTENEEARYIVQNLPTEVNTSVTFQVVLPEGTEVPLIAWDFGDGNGLGRYKKSLTATYKFTQHGVYQVYARIQGEEIPLTVVHTVHKTLPMHRPTHASTIVIDTARNYLWVVNSDNNSVSCINTSNNSLLHETSVGNHPRTIATDSLGNAWVTNEGDGTLTILSHQGAALKTINLGYASQPYGVCFDPLKRFAFVSLQGKGQLVKINAQTQTIVATCDIGRMPRGIAVTSDGSKIFVSQFLSPQDKGLVREINAANMIITKEIELAYDNAIDFEDKGRGVPNYLASLTITPNESELWIPSKKDNTARGLFRDSLALSFDNTVRTIVSKIALSNSTEDINSRVDINDADQASAVEFSPYGNIAFIALQGNGRISMLNTEGNTRLGILETKGIAPQGLVFNENGTKLYVHNFLSRSITVFDTKDIILSNNFSPVIDTIIKTIYTELLEPQILKGKQIFYNAQDERMTFAGYISCASCHVDGGSDERVWDFTERGEGLRNTHSLLGRRGMGMGRVHWTSNFDEIQDFENDIRNGFKGKGFMPDVIFNSGTISDPLGDKKAGLNADLDALAAYVTSLNKVHASPYRNQDGSLTADALEGKLLFSNLGCNSCHSGIDFTDRSNALLHDVGTYLPSSGKRRNSTLTGFGTPTLKGVWESAPYLHDGSAATLKDVLTTRNVNDKHGNVSSLTNNEIDKLIAYLNQIDENEANITSISNYFIDKIITLNISPNPSSDIVHVQLNQNSKQNGTILIYNATDAKLLKNITVANKNEIDINVSSLKPGIYILEFNNGTRKSISKFVIE